MLKRNGEPSGQRQPRELNRGEKEAFNEAYEAIQEELDALERLKQNVKDMASDPVVFTIPGGTEAGSVIHIPNVPVDRWQICSPLLKLRDSQIFLCERSIQGTKEFAVIERFKSDSPYAQVNANAEVLMAGDDPVLLVEQYAQVRNAPCERWPAIFRRKRTRSSGNDTPAPVRAASFWQLPTAVSPPLHSTTLKSTNNWPP